MSLGTDISISKVNPIRFAMVDSNLPSFDNTLFADESFPGITSKYFIQRFEYKDSVLLQIMGEDETPVLTKIVDGVETVISLDNTETYTGFKIYEYQFGFDTVGECIYFTAETSTSSWKSEPIEIVEQGELSADHYKLEWYNNDPPTENNNWGFDFSTTIAKANVNYIWIETLFLDYNPGGEATIYDNQNEKEIIKQSNFRTLSFASGPIPRYLCEMIGIFMGMDVFCVNDIQYIKEENPEIERFGGTNLFNLTASLTQKTVIGINTFDTGFDCDSSTDSNVVNLKITDGSGANTLTATEGHTINQIICELKTGASGVVKIGYTVGGEEIIRAWTLTTADPFILFDSESIEQSGMIANYSIYVDISGAGATMDVYIQTINILP